MNIRKAKLITLSTIITIGLCVSVNIAVPVLWRTNSNPANTKHQKAEPTPSEHSKDDTDITPNKSKPSGVRRSYAS